jgi:organic radical activating enzyme
MSLYVSEIFGPTIQGEGPTAGKRCAFVRLMLCNLTCSWCDTPYTWDFTGLNGTAYKREEQETFMSVEDIYQAIKKLDVERVVFSGGEPMMQKRELIPIFELLAHEGIAIEIETNGTILPAPELFPFITQINCSPKLNNSGLLFKKRRKIEVLKGLMASGTPVAFKFVSQSKECLDEVEEIQLEAGIPDRNIWIMPEGRSIEETSKHMAVIADDAIARGWNITPRTHVAIWGAERGH